MLFLEKCRESVISVVPIVLLVLLLHFTVAPLGDDMPRFLAGAALFVLGLGLFLMGADIGVLPVGQKVGSALTARRSLPLMLAVGFLVGFIITVAEPDVQVLAAQVIGVAPVLAPMALVCIIGVGVGFFVAVAMGRIIFQLSLKLLLILCYLAVFTCAAFVPDLFVGIGFDAGGATTGPMTVPFIMALGVGIAATIGGKDVGENSFGLIAMCSVGPILAVILLGATADGELSYQVPDYAIENGLGFALVEKILHTLKEVGIALGLIVLFFAILQITVLKLPRKKLGQIAVGIAYTFFGLVIFLTAVSVGFMPIGYKLGTELANLHPAILVISGFILGMVVVLAEPAVHVLNKQVEDITDGSVSKKSMMIALSLGVGISMALSMLRIVFDFSILFYVIPGYLISLGLSFFVPGIYTAIAFDSGGVASGPLTSGFILPLAIGACCALQGEGKVLADGFGIVAMVAMTPLITIQLLGFRAVVHKKVRDRIAMKRILSSDDEQIIRFM